MQSAFSLSSPSSAQPIPHLAHEPLFIGIDIGKHSHVAGFVSATLLKRHRRFEQCPALSFANSRAGFDALLTRLGEYSHLAQCAVVLESTGHYHKVLQEFLLEQGITTYIVHVQKRPERMMKSDKRDALSLALNLYNQVGLGVQVTEAHSLVRKVVSPSPTALALKSLMRHRYELAQEAAMRKNKLTAICDELFPELSTFFKDPNKPIALSVRTHFPTPLALAQASLADLRAAKIGMRPSDEKLLALQALAKESIGTRDEARLRGLVFEQRHLIAELALIQQHLDELNAEIVRIVEDSREGKILLSLPVLGPIQAASLIATIGTIDNFPRASQLKAYLGWAPALTQTGSTLDRSKLSRRGVRSSRHMLYMATLVAVREEGPWKKLYNRLVPLKCRYDERTGRWHGKMKVIGRVAGQLIELIYMLLRRDADLLAATPAGSELPPPMLYDQVVHLAHMTGGYRPAKPPTPPTPQASILRLPQKT
jgi:transposase